MLLAVVYPLTVGSRYEYGSWSNLKNAEFIGNLVAVGNDYWIAVLVKAGTDDIGVAKLAVLTVVNRVLGFTLVGSLAVGSNEQGVTLNEPHSYVLADPILIAGQGSCVVYLGGRARDDMYGSLIYRKLTGQEGYLVVSEHIRAGRVNDFYRALLNEELNRNFGPIDALAEHLAGGGMGCNEAVLVSLLDVYVILDAAAALRGAVVYGRNVNRLQRNGALMDGERTALVDYLVVIGSFNEITHIVVVVNRDAAAVAVLYRAHVGYRSHVIGKNRVSRYEAALGYKLVASVGYAVVSQGSAVVNLLVGVRSNGNLSLCNRKSSPDDLSEHIITRHVLVVRVVERKGHRVLHSAVLDVTNLRRVA